MSKNFFYNRNRRDGDFGGSDAPENSAQKPKSFSPQSNYVLTGHVFMRDTLTGLPKEPTPQGRWLCLNGCGCDPYKDVVTNACVPNGSAPFVAFSVLPAATATDAKKP